MAFWPVFLLITSSHSLFLSQMLCIFVCKIILDETDVTENKTRPFPRFFPRRGGVFCFMADQNLGPEQPSRGQEGEHCTQKSFKTYGKAVYAGYNQCHFVGILSVHSCPPSLSYFRCPRLVGYTQPARRYDTIINLFI